MYLWPPDQLALGYLCVSTAPVYCYLKDVLSLERPLEVPHSRGNAHAVRRTSSGSELEPAQHSCLHWPGYVTAMSPLADRLYGGKFCRHFWDKCKPSALRKLVSG